MKIVTNILDWFLGRQPVSGTPDTTPDTTPEAKPKRPSSSLRLSYGVTERGAWWGRPDELPRNPDGTKIHVDWKLRLCQVPRMVDGCDKGGAFWGYRAGPGSDRRAWSPWDDDDHNKPEATVWCAWSDDPARVRIWMWATSRARAKEIAGGRLPHAKFYR
jgi:hypothetical protein